MTPRKGNSLLAWLPVAFPGDCLKSPWEIPLGFQNAAEEGAWEISWASYWQSVLLQMNWHGERSEESPFGDPELKQKGLGVGGRIQTEKQSTHSFLQQFARYSCLLGHHSWDVSCLGQLYPHLSFAAWGRSSEWTLSVTPSLLKQRPLPLMSLTQSVKAKVSCRETLGWTLNTKDWHHWTHSNLYQESFWLVVFHTVFKDCVMNFGFSPHSIYLAWLEVLRKIWDRDILSICRLGTITLQWSITGVKYSSMLI